MFQAIFDFINPRACRICGKRLTVDEDEICTICNLNLPRTCFSKEPYENRLAKLFWGRFPVERVAALYYHQPHSASANLIYDLKYHHAPQVGIWLGRMAADEMKGDNFFEGIDAILPVPITWWRRWQRGYNQSQKIAEGIKEITHIPIYNNIVKRVSFSGSQTHKTLAERRSNIENAFRLNSNKAQSLAGKHILIVDDVITTGATIGIIGELLKEIPGIHISALGIGCTTL